MYLYLKPQRPASPPPLRWRVPTLLSTGNRLRPAAALEPWGLPSLDSRPQGVEMGSAVAPAARATWLGGGGGVAALLVSSPSDQGAGLRSSQESGPALSSQVQQWGWLRSSFQSCTGLEARQYDSQACGLPCSPSSIRPHKAAAKLHLECLKASGRSRGKASRQGTQGSGLRLDRILAAG